MTVRSASFSDKWRALKKKRFKLVLSAFDHTSLSCIEDSSLSFFGGINAIIGANGSGKSTLAAAIMAALQDQEDERESGHDIRLQGATIHASIDLDSERFEALFSDGARSATAWPTLDVVWVNPSLPAEIVAYLDHDPTFIEDITSGLTPVSLTSQELHEVSYIVGKQYSSVAIFEIEDHPNFDSFAYFRVTNGGISYDSRGMGQGELVALNLYWHLKRSIEGSLLILEEPETHLSPVSQAALLDVLASVAVTKNLCVFLTTHSPTMVGRIEPSNLWLVTQHLGRSTVRVVQSRSEVERLLGVGSQPIGAFGVEDESSRALLRGILERFASDLLWSYEVVILGGEGNMQSFLKAVPGRYRWLRFVAVFDGDMRARMTDDKFALPFSFLPGVADPDFQLKDCTGVSDVHLELGRILYRDPKDLLLALDRASGADYHDWVNELSRALSIESGQLRSGLIALWLMNEENVKASQAFVETLRGFVVPHEE